ncbi:Vasa, partial [Caligus rogercresseyi]
GSGNLPDRINSFSELSLRSLIMENKPTPIQKAGIPLILGGRDIVACSQTGSGKTAAFLLPIIHFILEEGEISSQNSVQKPSCLIVAPTRELAIQIKDQARKFAKDSMIKSAWAIRSRRSHEVIECAYVMMEEEHRWVDILIATPGRLLDIVSRGIVSLEKVKFFVLDEADRMLDMGFLPEVKRMIAEGNMGCKGSRQTLMFSATFAYDVRQCAEEFLQDYVFVSVGIVGGVNKDVEQEFHQVDRFKKRSKLKEILEEVGLIKTLVFVETKKNADFLASWLSENKFPTTSIHGDRLQSQREGALNDFRSGRFPILVSTAVAARGLDIKGVEHVVNYDLPKTVDEYVHRVGRTGRVGNKGRATSFYDGNEASDRSLTQELIKLLKQGDVKVPDWMSADDTTINNNNDSSHSNANLVNTAAEEEEWD